jgi:lipopolysaccharide/colanic/teichoic acid biosynthesis glycosyltransferase
MYRLFIKPLLDFLVTLFAVIILSPVFLMLSATVFFIMGRPVIFSQSRPGKNEKIFKLYKFRTMTNDISSGGKLLSDSERITKFGNFLRKTSLDEIPQFFNVLKGDLSLVGPRPLLTEYLPLYNDFQKKRHLIRPGITGLAQVNGRNAITWEEKFRLDIYYLENISFALDFTILLKTIKMAVTKRDINTPSGSTMDKFEGSLK